HFDSIDIPHTPLIAHPHWHQGTSHQGLRVGGGGVTGLTGLAHTNQKHRTHQPPKKKSQKSSTVNRNRHRSLTQHSSSATTQPTQPQRTVTTQLVCTTQPKQHNSK